jgi:hypothetical protein
VDHDWADRAGQRKGLVFPKVARLAVLTRRSERCVRNHLRHLERLGLISAMGNGGRGRPATVAIHWPVIVGEPKPCKRGAWPAHETLQRPAGPHKLTNEKKQARADAPSASPIGPPPRRGFWQEEIPYDEGTRALVARIRRVLTGEAAIGR